MTVSKATPSKWMYTNGTEIRQEGVIATERGWERQLPNGRTELLHAISGLGGYITTPLITRIEFPSAGNYEALNVITGTPDTISFDVSWAEELDTVTGTPRIAMDVGPTGQTVYAEYDSAVDANTLRFILDLADVTQTDDLDDALSAVLSTFGGATNVVDLNGGTITDVDANNADLDFTSAMGTPPANINVIVNAPYIVSITEPAAGSYSQGTSDPLSWVVTFSEAVDVAYVDSGLLITDGVGAETIPYASGTGTTEITFTQTADNLGLGEIVGVNDPALSRGTGGDEIQDADNNNVITARNSDYSATSGIIVTA